jgi:hypothetical protein
MRQQGLLPQANEEQKAFSSSNEKTQAVFPPLFESISKSGLRALESILGETGSVCPFRLGIRFFVVVRVLPLRAADTQQYMTDPKGILFPTRRRFLTDSLHAASPRSRRNPGSWSDCGSGSTN